MRGKVAKLLRRAAREQLLPADAPERQLSMLKGTHRHRDFRIPAKLVAKPKDWPEGKEWLDPSTPPRTVTIQTYTAINHPESVRGRYRLMKRAHRELRI